MAKLIFRYGAMNCGKSMSLLTVAHNYEENEKKIITIKSSIDTKADDSIQTRVGLERKVDILLEPTQSLRDYIKEWRQSDLYCILVDEAQFLTPTQVEELWVISKELDITVICYGLRTNFKTELFSGSKRLIELADDLEELATICECGKKAKFNSRFVDGVFATEGDSVLIDGSNSKVEYKPMCGKCFIKRKYNNYFTL